MNIFCELSTELLCCNELCRVISEKNQAILPTHELVIFTKFHNDWVKIRDIRSVFDLIPIIITILIFVLITNQSAHNSQVVRPACVASMSMVMRRKNGNGFEIEY